MTISELRIFSKNPALWLFYLYSLLTSCKKSKKSFEPFLRKLRYQPTNQPINQPALIWRPFHEYLQIKIFFPKIRLCENEISSRYPPHHPLFTDDSNTAKKHKLSKQCFLPPLHRFFIQSSQYQYWKASKYSILTVIVLGPPVLDSSTWSQNFMLPLILNTNFIKPESEIGYSQDSISH